MTTWSPPIIPSRLPGWEHSYASMVQELAARPFSWGQSDCLTRVADLCETMTGVNPLPGNLRRYRTEKGAQAVMARLGFERVEDVLKAVFPEVSVSKARRGDCGIADVRFAGNVVQSTFIVIGVNAIGANERGPVVVSTLALRRTFRVG